MISERFPNSGLSKVCLQLLSIAHQAKARSAWIEKPIVTLRIAVGLLAALIAAGLLGTLLRLDMPTKTFEFTQFIQVLEAGINDVVLIGAGIFLLFTLESRVKRRRALKAIHELRVISHIIDMHQLTKDPERLFSGIQTLAYLPVKMTAFELGRYLDYCSEMLSLAGKIAACTFRISMIPLPSPP